MELDGQTYIILVEYVALQKVTLLTYLTQTCSYNTCQHRREDDKRCCYHRLEKRFIKNEGWSGWIFLFLMNLSLTITSILFTESNKVSFKLFGLGSSLICWKLCRWRCSHPSFKWLTSSAWMISHWFHPKKISFLNCSTLSGSGACSYIFYWSNSRISMPRTNEYKL